MKIGSNWRAILATAANIAAVVAFAAVLVAVCADLYRARRAGPGAAAQPEPAAFTSGAEAPSIAGVDYSRSERTLLLFLSVDCRYCKQSVPFYRDLAASLRASPSQGATRRIVAVFAEDAAQVRAFVGQENLNIECAAGVPFRTLGVTGTPAALLVSRGGRVLQVWRGAPEMEEQEEIRKALIPG